jgi:zinc D-Ala-D-Ala carboxypeptidase
MTLTLRYFEEWEYACKCGCGYVPTLRARLALDNLRHELGEPLYIASGARCPHHNARVGGAKNSRHMMGEAFDIRIHCRNKRFPLFLLLAGGNGFKGVGIYQNFTHIDLGPIRMWNKT